MVNYCLGKWEIQNDTRGHSLKLRKGRCLKDTKKHSFPQRSIDTWNNLTQQIITPTSVHKFKERLEEDRNRDKTTLD